MSKVILFEHNEVAYEKLIKDLEVNMITTINHATGTGKSFIILKYLYEHRDKKFLYLSPTYPIIDQLFESCYKIGITPKDINVDTMIYHNLLQMDMKQIYESYDGIIFDEYHRIGAKETYKKVKELKLLLKEKNDEKKFIGFTATPIRYLDHERNMTEEIFDGNVASFLSLSEAMLEGILPVPTYINSKIACNSTYKSVLSKVKKMYPSAERDKLLKKLEKVEKKINNGVPDKTQLVNRYIKQKDGKYIVFCNTIDELDKYYSEVDSWFKDLGPIKKYKVHSKVEVDLDAKGKDRTIKKQNKKTLDKFNKDKKGISILFCVDILNEGVHVDNIDGIFMLRRTISPIIYFQQIGRALSFSGRKKEIKIFDLVNNFNNHMAIDMIYQEVHQEFEKKIMQEPKNREKYEEILHRFKIMDETKDILSELGNISEQVTKEKIVATRIDYSINMLEQFVKSGKKTSEIFEDDNAKKAYTLIAKYSSFVDNVQFERLLNLDIILPDDLTMTAEEREKLLCGYKNFYEKSKAEYSFCIKDVIDFINENNRLPSEIAENDDEKNLARRYLYGLNDINNEQKEKLKIVCKDREIKINVWEKILFQERITQNDINQAIEVAQSYINNEKEMPDYLVITIKEITRRYDIEENKLLFELLEKSEKIKQNNLEKVQKARYELLNKIDKYLKIHIDDSPQELNESGIIDIIKGLKPKDYKYITLKYEILKREKYKKIVSGLGDDSVLDFCKKMKYLDEEQFELYFKLIERSEEINEFIIKLIEFITSNNGNYPSIQSEDEEERKLAEQFNIYSKDEIERKRFEILEKDKNNKLYNPLNVIYKLSMSIKRNNKIKIVILKSVQFLKKHGRKPLVNSSNSEEKDLAIEYETECIKELNDSEISILNRIFNNKKNFQKTCNAFISNLKKQEGIDQTD